MAPDAPLVVAETEKPYAIMDSQGSYINAPIVNINTMTVKASIMQHDR